MSSFSDKMAALSVNQNASAAAPTPPTPFLNPLITFPPSIAQTRKPHPDDVFLVCQTRQPLWTDSFMGRTVISRNTVLDSLTHVCCACPSMAIARRQLGEAAVAYKNHPNIVNILQSMTPGHGDGRFEISFFRKGDEQTADFEGHTIHKVEDFMTRFHIVGPVRTIR